MPRWVILFLCLLVLSLIASAFGAGYYLAPKPEYRELPPELSIIGEAWEALSEEYINKAALDPKKMSYGAIKGMLKVLDDPYTSFLPPELYKLEMASYKGKFEGIGAHVQKTKEGLKVIAPMPGTPAQRAGIKSGDIILEINGESVEEMSLIEAVLRIRGPKGTAVKLLILHPGVEKPVELIIIREEIEVKSVYLQTMDSIAHVRITQFTERTPKELRAVLQQIEQQAIKGIILDLRNNPGGLLNAVVKVAGEFLEDGVAVYELGREGKKIPWPIKRLGIATKTPLVVLVNEYSASGSEVLAGALQDRDRAILIGTKTFGKGSVNILRRLKDGSGLYITRARWLTPKGKMIEGKGLIPDIIEEDKELQLEKALQYIKSKV